MTLAIVFIQKYKEDVDYDEGRKDQHKFTLLRFLILSRWQSEDSIKTFCMLYVLITLKVVKIL